MLLGDQRSNTFVERVLSPTFHIIIYMPCGRSATEHCSEARNDRTSMPLDVTMRTMNVSNSGVSDPKCNTFVWGL